MAQTHYPALTGIRALAIGMVFIHHHGPHHPALQHPVAQAITGQMFSGVGFFFVLSGFLIADRYFDAAKARFRGYFMRRVLRVMPLYMLLTAMTFGVFMATGAAPVPALLFELAANLTLLRGWFEELWLTGIGQGWSLTVEMTFYGLAPFLFALVSWRRWMLVMLPIGFAAVGVLLVIMCHGKAPLGFMGSYPFMFGITFFGRCTEFFIGIAVAFLLRRTGPKSFRYTTLCGGIMCVATIGVAAYLDVDYRDPGGVLIQNLLLPIGVGCFYSGLLTERTMARSLLSSPVALFMGRTSYAFYLIHTGVVFTAVHALTHSLVLSFMLLQGAAWVLYRLVEDPIARWSHRRFPMEPSPLTKESMKS